MRFLQMLRRPSAFLPISMSLLALTVVLIHIALVGAAREADEGAAAHLWQLLMAAQLPVIAFFAVKWLPRQPKTAAAVIVVQAITIVAALAPVFLLNL